MFGVVWWCRVGCGVGLLCTLAVVDNGVNNHVGLSVDVAEYIDYHFGLALLDCLLGIFKVCLEH